MYIPIANYSRSEKSNEPTFTLRAQDMFAPCMIFEWANNVEANVNKSNDPKATLKKIESARAIAGEMIAWQLRNKVKIPD